jgi:hypothetical protein
MIGTIIITNYNGCYSWSISTDNLWIERKASYRTPERAVRSARRYAEILGIVVMDDVEQRCR